SGPGVYFQAQRFLRADFVIQHGSPARGTVEFLDITFNPGTVDFTALLSSGRLRLTQYATSGMGSGTSISLTGAVSYSGNTLSFDFGSAGLPDGYYVLEADLDGDGIFESAWRFFRKQGDTDGTSLNNPPPFYPPLYLNG